MPPTALGLQQLILMAPCNAACVLPCTQHLAKEVVQSRKAVGRIYTNKAHMQSLSTALTEQLGKPGLLDAALALRSPCARRSVKALLRVRRCVSRGQNSSRSVGIWNSRPSNKQQNSFVPRTPAAMLRVAGTLSKSTEVMKEVNTIIKAPELQKTMVEMSKGKEQTCRTEHMFVGW